MYRVDPHLLVSYKAVEAVLEALEKLPETDITNELKNIASLQAAILEDHMAGRHYGSTALDQVLSYLNQLTESWNNPKQE